MVGGRAGGGRGAISQRVSPPTRRTPTKTLTGQIDALKAAGVGAIFRENATVADADVITAKAATVVINPNTWLGTATANFTDTDISNVAGDFSATINWGDGTPVTLGTVTDVGGLITVSGSHAYAAAGQFPVTVTLADNTPGTALATAHTTANVDQDTSKDPAPASSVTSHCEGQEDGDGNDPSSHTYLQSSSASRVPQQTRAAGSVRG